MWVEWKQCSQAANRLWKQREWLEKPESEERWLKLSARSQEVKATGEKSTSRSDQGAQPGLEVSFLLEI